MKEVEYNIELKTYYNMEGEYGDIKKQELKNIVKNTMERIKIIKDFEFNSIRRQSSTHTSKVKLDIVTYITDNKDNDIVFVKNRIKEILNKKEPNRDPYKTKEEEKGGFVQFKKGIPVDGNEVWELSRVNVLNSSSIKNLTSGSDSINVSLDFDESEYEYDEKPPEREMYRELYQHEFDIALESIMKDVDEILYKENYKSKLTRSLKEKQKTQWDCCSTCGGENIEIHHNLVRHAFKHYMKNVIRLNYNKILISEETGTVQFDASLFTEITKVVHNPEVLTPLCSSCHHNVHSDY